MYHHELEYRPRQSDLTRPWALSMKQPMASLVAAAACVGPFKSHLPPAELVGQRLYIHAGGSDHTLKSMTPEAQEIVEAALGYPPKLLRAGKENELVHGAIIGSAILRAAFRPGRIIGGKIFASLKEGPKYSASYCGVWREFDGRPQAVMGDLVDKWVWCFDDFSELTKPELLTGLGGIFDLNGARAARDGHERKPPLPTEDSRHGY